MRTYSERRAAPSVVIAVFDDLSSVFDVLQLLRDPRPTLVHHREGAQSEAAPLIRARLEADAVDVVVWDVSPALSLYCDRLERMLDRQAFAGCALIVTTTHAARLREYFGVRCPEMTVLQRPCSVQQLDEAIAQTIRLPHERAGIRAVFRPAATGSEPGPQRTDS